MTEYKLFTYADPVDGTPFAASKTIDLQNVTDAGDKVILQKWFPVDPTDTAKYARAILEGFDKLNIWLGIGRRECEVVDRWQEGHPWLPEKISLPDHPPLAKKDLLSDDAAPITQANLFKELKELVELSKLSSEIQMKSIQAEPAWGYPTDTRTDLRAGDKPFVGQSAYHLGESSDIAFAQWQIVVREMVTQFLNILPDLHLKHQADLHLEDVDINDCRPHPIFKCEGLCGAWYIVKVKYVEDPKDKKIDKQLKIRVPVGLIQPTRVGDPTPMMVAFDGEKRDVYTLGLDLTFICLKDQVIPDKFDQEFKSRLIGLQTKFQKQDDFKNQKSYINSLLGACEDKLKTPTKNLKLLNSDAWQKARGIDRTKEACDLSLKIIGKEPLAVLTDDGIHLLENEKQSSVWCAEKKLLDRLWQPLPWNIESAWLEAPLKLFYSEEKHDFSLPEDSIWISMDNGHKKILWPGGRAALENKVSGMDDAKDYAQQLFTVRSAMGNGLNDKKDSGMGGKNCKQVWDESFCTTIRQFRVKNSDERKEFINVLWKILTTAYKFDKLSTMMCDPTYADDIPNKPLPTSWCPTQLTRPGVQTYHKRLPTDSQPWRQFAVGFRVEGEWSGLKDTLDRYKKNSGQGMTQWRINKKYMFEKKRMDFTGTILDDPTQFIFWNGNNDTFNETAVCVSRNFFGATAFPERSSQGEYALFALDCSNLMGFDTEDEQVKLRRPWRPGEKAFKEIPYKNIIGWVCISRKDCDSWGGWKFSIDRKADWSFNPVWLSNADTQKTQGIRTYIKSELAAWRDIKNPAAPNSPEPYIHNIPPKFDFA